MRIVCTDRDAHADKPYTFGTMAGPESFDERRRGNWLAPGMVRDGMDDTLSACRFRCPVCSVNVRLSPTRWRAIVRAAFTARLAELDVSRLQ